MCTHIYLSSKSGVIKKVTSASLLVLSVICIICEPVPIVLIPQKIT